MRLALTVDIVYNITTPGEHSRGKRSGSIFFFDGRVLTV